MKGRALTNEQLAQIVSCNPSIPISPALKPTGSGTFGADLFERLPSMLHRACNLFDEAHQRDVLLVSSLPVLASLMPNVRITYGGVPHSLNLFAVIVAPAGSGKGAMRWARRLAEDTHTYLERQHQQELAAWKASKSKGEPPAYRSLFVPGNSSASALIENLAGNRGVGLMIESEIATLTATLGQEWGQFEDVLLKTFHNETVTVGRRNERQSLLHPALSLCLSGTPTSLQPLLRSVENGLFSRFLIYQFIASAEWVSQRPKAAGEVECFFQDQSIKLKGLYQALASQKQPLIFSADDGQWDRLDEVFGELFNQARANRKPLLFAAIKRTALAAMRVATILTILRKIERSSVEQLGDVGESKKVDTVDLESAITIVTTLLHHAEWLHDTMPQERRESWVEVAGRMQLLYTALPNDQFPNEQAYQIGGQMGIPNSTVRRYLQNLASNKKMIKLGRSLWLKL